MALTPDGSSIYISEGVVLNQRSTSTGAIISTIVDVAFSDLTGVCLSPTLSPTNITSVSFDDLAGQSQMLNGGRWCYL